MKEDITIPAGLGTFKKKKIRVICLANENHPALESVLSMTGPI